MSDDTLTATDIATLGADGKVDTIVFTTPRTLTNAQFAAASTKLSTDQNITISDEALSGEDVAALGTNDKVDTIRDSSQTLTLAQYTAAKDKLDAADAITVSDNALTATDIATLGADNKVDTIRVAAATLTLAQYNAPSAKLNAADAITVSDDTLTAAQIATLGADGKVDTIRVATATLTLEQYNAASLKLDAADTITVSDDTLTSAQIATLGADNKVDTIRVAAATLTLAQYSAPSAKLNITDTITISDNTLTAAQIATLGADVKVDTIRVASATLTLEQYNAASAKLNAADAITVDDNTLTGAQIATLGTDPKVDTIRDTSQSLTLEQYTAAKDKLNAADAITVSDDTLTAADIATLGVDNKVDTIRVATATLTVAQFNAASAKLNASDTITVEDTASSLVSLTGSNKIDSIIVNNDASISQLASIHGNKNASSVVTYGVVADTGANLAANAGSYISANREVTVTNAATIAQLTTIDGLTTGQLNYTAVSDTALNLINDRLTNLEAGTYVIDTVETVTIARSATVTVADAEILGTITGISQLSGAAFLTVRDTSALIINFINDGYVNTFGNSNVILSVSGNFSQVELDQYMALENEDTYPTVQLNLAFATDTLSLEQARWVSSHGSTASMNIYTPEDEGVSDTDLVTVSSTTTLSQSNLLKAMVAAGYKNITYDGSASDVGLNINLTGVGTTITDRVLVVNGGDFNDTIVGTSRGETIQGGLGKDTLRGGLGADIFEFALLDSKAISAATINTANIDTILDFNKTQLDVIKFTNISVASNAASSGVGSADIATGLATFNAADDTLSERITAIVNTLGTSSTGAAVQWKQISDSYIFISDGTAGLSDQDVLIKLTGVAGNGLIDNGDTISLA